MKKWAEIIEEKRDEIFEEIKEAKIEMRNERNGLEMHVEIDEKHVWRTSLMTQNSQSATSFNGESYIVLVVKAWDLDEDTSDMDEDEIQELVEETVRIYADEIHRDIDNAIMIANY